MGFRSTWKMLQPVKLGQCLRHLYRGSDVGDHPGWHRFCADCRGERKLVEQGSDQIDTTVWQVSMPLDDRKIRRIGQFAIDGRQAGDLIQEIVLINEPWL